MEENLTLNWRKTKIDLDKRLQMFYAEVRTKDGLEYEPDRLKPMLAALQTCIW